MQLHRFAVVAGAQTDVQSLDLFEQRRVLCDQVLKLQHVALVQLFVFI